MHCEPSVRPRRQTPWRAAIAAAYLRRVRDQLSCARGSGVLALRLDEHRIAFAQQRRGLFCLGAARAARCRATLRAAASWRAVGRQRFCRHRDRSAQGLLRFARAGPARAGRVPARPAPRRRRDVRPAAPRHRCRAPRASPVRLRPYCRDPAAHAEIDEVVADERMPCAARLAVLLEHIASTPARHAPDRRVRRRKRP